MTEDEAKTKWCPHALTVSEPVGFGALRIKQTNDGKCIGSECMAWRKINMAGDGYCGLAGEP